MKIKVGNKIYDAEDQPIMVILTDGDKDLISRMHPDATKYCSAPDTMKKEDLIAFMKTDD